MRNKTITFICLFIFTIQLSKAQVIRVENGISLSSLRAPDNPNFLLTEPIYPYHFSIGLDYFIHKRYQLSSNIGYLAKGGETLPFEVPIVENNISKTLLVTSRSLWKYITLDTTFDLTYPLFNKIILYAGTGPRIDIYTTTTNKSKLIDPELGETKFSGNNRDKYSKSVIYGLRCKAGFSIPINDFEVGATFSYLPGFNKIFKEGDQKERTFTLGLSVGYWIYSDKKN